MKERAKAHLDWKFEVAFGLLEVFDRLVSTVGAISPGSRLLNVAAPQNGIGVGISVKPRLNPWISLKSPLSISTESAPVTGPARMVRARRAGCGLLAGTEGPRRGISDQ
jgi:hypothetical protein